MGVFIAATAFQADDVALVSKAAQRFFAEHGCSAVEIAALTSNWSGNPAVVAAALGKSEADIAGYLVHLRSGDTDADEAKVSPGDHSELGDPWVFTDFWRQIGISYRSVMRSYE